MTEQTEWINIYVIVEKEVEIDTANAHSPSHTIKKKIRLCLDPKDLNNSLEWEPYYSRSIDELIAKFGGAVIFTIVNMDKGYWQVELHPDSWKYTCMALDIRRFQWKHLPMGTVVASDIFQKKLDSVYTGLPGVTGIADDMIIFGKSELEHDRNLLQFLETTRKNGLVLNKSKLRPQEDRFNPQNGIPKGQGNHALIPWTHQFLELVQSTVSRIMYTSEKSHPQGCTLQCHRGTSISIHSIEE